MRYFYTQTLLAKARVTTHNARARMLVVYPPRGGCAREAGAERKILLRGHGCGGWRGSLAVTECELCTVHKLGAAPGAGVIGGYGGVTAGLRGAFFGFAGGFVQYCGGAFFLALSGKVFKISAGAFLGGLWKCVQNLGTALF